MSKAMISKLVVASVLAVGLAGGASVPVMAAAANQEVSPNEPRRPDPNERRRPDRNDPQADDLDSVLRQQPVLPDAGPSSDRNREQRVEMPGDSRDTPRPLPLDALLATAIVAAIAALGDDATQEEIQTQIEAIIARFGADPATVSSALVLVAVNIRSNRAILGALAAVNAGTSQPAGGAPAGGPASGGTPPAPPPPPAGGGGGSSDY